MMSIVKKWRIIIHPNSITFYIHDNHYSNMLSKLKEIDFGVEPVRVEITAVQVEDQKGQALVGEN